MTWITVDNVQRVITPRVIIHSYDSCVLQNWIMVIYICITFQETISNSFQVTALSQIYYRNHYFQSSKGHNSKRRLTRVTVLVFCILSYNAFHLYKVSFRYLECFKLTERTRVHSRNGYFQYLLCSKDRSSKNRLTRKRFFFLCVCVLHIVSWCFTIVSFNKISGTVFKLQSGHKYMVEIAMFNIQRAITPKVGKQELWFIYSARRSYCLTFVWKCRENTSKSFQLTERTRVHGWNGYVQYVQCSKGNNSKSRKTRVTVYVFFTLSRGALHLCEVWWKYQTVSVLWSGHDGSADGRTDGRSYVWTFVGYYSVNFSAQNTQQDA